MASAAAMPCTVSVPWRRRVVIAKGLDIHRGYGLPKRHSASSLSSLENVAARTLYGARPLPWLTCPVDRFSRAWPFTLEGVSAASPGSLEHHEAQTKNQSQSILDRMPVSMALERMPRHITSM